MAFNVIDNTKCDVMCQILRTKYKFEDSLLSTRFVFVENLDKG